MAGYVVDRGSRQNILGNNRLWIHSIFIYSQSILVLPVAFANSYLCSPYIWADVLSMTGVTGVWHTVASGRHRLWEEFYFGRFSVDF